MPESSASLTRKTSSAVAGPARSSSEDCLVRLNSDSMHDLMSPVNQVCAIADLILKKHCGKLDEETAVLVGFIQKAGSRLVNLLAGLRTYMQVVGPPLSPRHCDSNSLLASAVASMQHAIDASGAVVTHDPLPDLCCDPNQIVYTFSALIDNSIKFRRDPPPQIHVSAVLHDNTWLFSFRDNGIGIDTRYSQRIFTAFKRLDSESYAGSGVGLAIARQIVEQHGGRIWVESNLGTGTTFFFTLPRDAL